MTYAEQPHQLGLAITLRFIASRLCGALSGGKKVYQCAVINGIDIGIKNGHNKYRR